MDFAKALQGFAEQHGAVIYALLFAAFLFQTGFLIGPVLPGNPLVFAAGLLAAPANPVLNLGNVILAIAGGAFLGNLINYRQGLSAGPAFRRKPKWTDRIERTEAFFARHGTRTVAIAAFVPFYRAFVPFVAGMGRMNARRFVISSLIGCAGWIVVWSLLGYYLGAVPLIRNNVDKIMMGIVLLVSVVAIVKLIQLCRRSVATEA